MSYRILHGDALTVLRTLPDESAHCCVTSPPYWGLRDYGIAGIVGNYILNSHVVENRAKKVLDSREGVKYNGVVVRSHNAMEYADIDQVSPGSHLDDFGNASNNACDNCGSTGHNTGSSTCPGPGEQDRLEDPNNRASCEHGTPWNEACHAGNCFRETA